jgi:hypothetical protein
MRNLAKFYMFETKEKFNEHYLANRSLVLNNLNDFFRDHIANTVIYHKEDNYDVENKDVTFASNFFIRFVDNKIYFINFNKSIFNIEKDYVNEGEFINYIKSEIIEASDLYNELIRLK